MKTTTQTFTKMTVILSMKEVEEIVKEHLGRCASDEVKVIIQDEPENVIDDTWIHVPNNWNLPKCPNAEYRGLEVKVIYRCGKTETGFSNHFNNYWIQDGYNLDIIAYRKL